MSPKFECSFNTISLRRISSVQNKDNTGKISKFEPFSEMVKRRRSEASRSVLFFLSEKSSIEDLIECCNTHGKVNNCFEFYQNGYYAIIEFKKKESISSLRERIYKPDILQQFQNELIYHRLFKYDIKSNQVSISHRKKNYINKEPLNSDLIKAICHADSVSHQIEMLANEQALRDEGVRMRFLSCTLIEEACRTMFPDCQVLPFGSSVNNFGKRNCDVDMYLDLNVEPGMIPIIQNTNFKVVFDEESATNERFATQNTLRTLSKYLKKCVPHCTNVYNILHASCPLVKFRHQALGLSCDLTANNRGAIHSSEMLHIYSKFDKRVQPLVFLIRHWGRYHGLTNKSPGMWITNYPLTLLVVAFLQTRPVPILPKFLDLISTDSSFDDIDYSFPNVKGFLQEANETTLADLLHEFFVFCMKFEFHNRGLSVRHGSDFINNTNFPLFIENPLVDNLNCCKNVTKTLVAKLKSSAAEALWVMDKAAFLNTTPWGIALLFLTPKKIDKIMKEQASGPYHEQVERVLDLFPKS
ncbi:poly(A) RNA polymerase, mitochondrial-like [Antedon mediterranea]|uniref:poly(A) RNA polymerase, mitochondrial-like n=1 Tax=Antedon mediterranea TaxID=105859 RepID=UPI003AF91DA2